MATDYGFTTADRTTDSLIGDHPPVIIPVVLASGENLTRGHVLGVITASGKYTGYDADVATGEEVARAVLMEDTDASAGDAKTTALVHGVVRAADLTWDDEANDKAAGIKNLRAYGVYAK